MDIAVSARAYAGKPGARGAARKPAWGAEQNLLHQLATQGAAVGILPSEQGVSARVLLRRYDALVLQGGGDVSPSLYGHAPRSEGWQVDAQRDRFELDLIEAAIEAGKPVLGLCRGSQLLNVAFGGSLFHDVTSAHASAISHSQPELYERHAHGLRLSDHGLLDQIYPGVVIAQVSSAHSQGIDRLGRELVAEAWCEEDGLIEAIRWSGPAWVLGVQWHPEFHDAELPDLLPGAPLFAAFMAAAVAA